MTNSKFNMLNYINEGIIIANKDLEVVFWNAKIEEMIDIEDIFNKKIYEVLPKLNKEFFIDSMKGVLERDFKYFFSSAMHKNLISEEADLNIKLSRFEHKGQEYLIMECIDVTSQNIRINQLKGYNKDLQALNKKLREQEQEITRLAYYDNLTGLANRTFFYHMAEKFLYDAKRNNKRIGFMFIDIDAFKEINDSYGHLAGDKVLIEVSKILKDSIRLSDLVARHGGDEFLILLSDCKNYKDYNIIANRIAESNKFIKIDEDTTIEVALSIGVSFYPKDGENIDQLISKADKAMYKVKRSGGNQCASY
ncbi:MAG: sensor domain-containing diguanylate cyclase [Tissierellaceae bacterium]|nr:sensor domain-containing diguanylate cyclase [Tissierellaceae bacterium]